MNDTPVKIYSLSTCGNCRETMNFLAQNSIEFTFVDVDLLEKEERNKTLDELKQYNPKRSFPTTVSDKGTIVGYDVRKLKEVFNLS